MLSAGASAALSPQLDTTHRTLCILTRDTAAIPTPVPGLVLSLMTLLPVSAAILCFKEHLTPGKWPVWTCVPFRRFYLDGALLHITGFHDDHHLNPNLNCLWELRCGGILPEHRPYKVIITTLTVCVRGSDASAHIAFQHFTICPLLVHFCCYLFCFLCCWCFCLILTSVNVGSRGELRAAVSVSLSLIVNATVSASNCQVLKCVASIRTNDNDSN